MPVMIVMRATAFPVPVDASVVYPNICTKSPSVAEWFTTVEKTYYDSRGRFSPSRISRDAKSIACLKCTVPLERGEAQ